MNRTNQDKTWELAAIKIHKESDLTVSDDVKSQFQDSGDKKIFEYVHELHEDLINTSPLHHTSLYHSWDKIALYIKKKQIGIYLQISKYAAIILLSLGMGTLLQIKFDLANKSTKDYTEIYAPLGQMSEITLPDKTHVWLNSGTILKYCNDFGRNSRNVELVGEAFFKVKHGQTPFKVKLKNNEIEVLGTSFSAVAYPDEDYSQVTLIEGSVQVNNNTGQVVAKITPNYQLHIPDNPKIKISAQKINPMFYESWINGKIKFDQERLIDVARRMERWYNVDIIFKDEKTQNIRFTGTVLKSKPIDQSMKAIGLLLPINVNYENNLEKKDIITISKK